MELRHLRYFEAVADEGHFGRAAKRLHMAQPPLSRQIQQLEQELELQLFDRTRRRADLTPAGLVFREHARSVLAAVDAAVVAARRAARGETGRIVVGYLSSLAYSGIAGLLRAFHTRFPEVEIALRELGPQPQIDAIKTGLIDVGFTRAPLADDALASESIRREPLVVALAEDHRLAKRPRIALEALARDPFILFPRPRSPAFYDQLIALCQAHGFSPTVAQEAPHLDILSLVAAGFGVAIMPDSARHLRREGLVFRPIVGGPMTELVMAWRASDRSPTVHEFRALARDHGLGKPQRKTSRKLAP